MAKRPEILTIAGFDPSGGAGILADIKTFEKNKCQGFAVQTANTAQTEDEFLWVDWINPDKIIEQLKLILSQYTFKVVKIGLVESLDVLDRISQTLKKERNVKIIWDPILKSSSGFTFHENTKGIEAVLENLYMITPNWDEMKEIGESENCEKTAAELSEKCLVYLKGGHREDQIGRDILFSNGKKRNFNPKTGQYSPKHGSGCVFSAALSANIARGYPIQKAILKSKRYIEHYLKSTDSLLGYHLN